MRGRGGGRRCVKQQRPHEEDAAARNDADYLGYSVSPLWNLDARDFTGPVGSWEHAHWSVAHSTIIEVQPNG